MTRNHIRFCILQSFKCNYRMKEDSRLCNFCFFQFFLSSIKHYITNIKTKNIICLFKKRFAFSFVSNKFFPIPLNCAPVPEKYMRVYSYRRFIKSKVISSKNQYKLIKKNPLNI